MAEFTYQTRKKITENWVNGLKEKGSHLSPQEKDMLPDVYGYTIPQNACGAMRKLLADGSYESLSELYKSRYQKLVDVCVPECKDAAGIRKTRFLRSFPCKSFDRGYGPGDLRPCQE